MFFRRKNPKEGGAACGQPGCILNVLRISARYGNLGILEDGYGINLLPLAQLANKYYSDDPCSCFQTKGDSRSGEERELNIRIHKAVSVMQFKIEGQLAAKRPEFHMEDKKYLERIDYDKWTVTVDGKEYPLKDQNFPTVDPKDPNRLTEDEAYVLERLQSAFTGCKRLQKHMELLLQKGSLYKVYNGNLLFHGCMPLDENGDFKEVELYGHRYKGKELYDYLDMLVRRAFFSMDDNSRQEGQDILWWIWCNKDSPLFGKEKMTTFERCLIEDKATHEEKKTPYYSLIDDVAVIEKILAEFGLSGEHTHIVNGHVPVKRGETPVHANGRVLVIDGGFSKAYQDTTGIAGYTLIFNSWGLRLVAHEPFTSMDEAVRRGSDIHSDNVAGELYPTRLVIGDTDEGIRIRQNIEELEELLRAYRSGDIVQSR